MDRPLRSAEVAPLGVCFIRGVGEKKGEVFLFVRVGACADELCLIANNNGNGRGMRPVQISQRDVI